NWRRQATGTRRRTVRRRFESWSRSAWVEWMTTSTAEPVPLTRARIDPAPGLRLRLPYPVRNALGRWRALISMMLGVGIALSIGMTILGVISAEMDLLTGDYERSGVGVYVSTQGGKIVARLAGDTPGTIREATTVLAQVRG